MPHLIPSDTRRWAFYSIGARMLPTDTGRDHEPTRRGLEHSSGLLAVDHPQFWSPRDLVTRATWQHGRPRERQTRHA